MLKRMTGIVAQEAYQLDGRRHGGHHQTRDDSHWVLDIAALCNGRWPAASIWLTLAVKCVFLDVIVAAALLLLLLLTFQPPSFACT